MRKFLKRLVKRRLAERMDIPDSEIGILFSRNSCVTELTDAGKLTSLIQSLSPTMGEGKELIRFGPEGDGGYLIPDDLEGIEGCFSLGVGKVSGFERDCVDAGMKVFLADNSVEKPEDANNNFHFTKKHVAVTTSDDYMTIDDWVSMCLPNTKSDLLLQIDIEGAEYEVFLNMSNSLTSRFRIIVAEFHGLEVLWSQPFFDIASRAFDKLLQTHSCVHIHPNNCCGSVQRKGLEIPRVAEFTFLRSDRMTRPTRVDSFPHPLDRDNTANLHMALPRCWYGPR